MGENFVTTSLRACHLTRCWSTTGVTFPGAWPSTERRDFPSTRRRNRVGVVRENVSEGARSYGGIHRTSGHEVHGLLPSSAPLLGPGRPGETIGSVHRRAARRAAPVLVP